MFTSGHAIRISGLTYRQLDHVVRNGHVRPTHRGGTGRGTLRHFSARDLLALRLAKELLAAGHRLRPFKSLLQFVQRGRGLPPLDKLQSAVLFSDPARIVALGSEESQISASQTRCFSYVVHLGPAAEHVRIGIERISRTASQRRSSTA